MADYQAFRVELKDKIAHVQINRPEKRNAMNSAFWTEIIEIFTWADRTDDVRVVVLSGAGEHFSSGIDLNLLAQAAALATSAAWRKRCGATGTTPRVSVVTGWKRGTP